MPAPPNPRTQPAFNFLLNLCLWQRSCLSQPEPGTVPWEGCTKLGAITSGNPSFGCVSAQTGTHPAHNTEAARGSESSRRFLLPLLGSNQDSPDPEGPASNSRIPATCNPLREFVSPDAGVCWFRCSDFADFYSLKCSGWRRAGGRLAMPPPGPGHRARGQAAETSPISCAWVLGAGLSSRTSGMRTSRGIWNSSQTACQVVTPSRALAICDRSSDVRCGRLPLSTSSEIVNSTASCQVDGGSVELVPFSASTI